MIKLELTREEMAALCAAVVIAGRDMPERFLDPLQTCADKVQAALTAAGIPAPRSDA